MKVCSYLLLLALSVSADIVRGPYLQRVHQSGVTVCLRTVPPQAVQIHLWQGDKLIREIESLPVKNHIVAIEHLQPATQYSYSVISGDHRMQWLSFRTAPKPNDPFRVWVTGNSGTGNADAHAVRDAYWTHAQSAPPSLWLMLGNNAYSSGTDQEFGQKLFETYPEQLQTTPFYSTRGNHAQNTETYYRIHVNPKDGEAGGISSGTEAYYSVAYGCAHFICLDSYATSLKQDSPMLAWLKEDLANTQANWIVAFFHHPPYSGGSQHSDNCRDSGGRLCRLRERFVPVLEAAGVDLVLTAHTHAYQRSSLLRGHYGRSSQYSPTRHVLHAGQTIDDQQLYQKPAVRAPGTIYVVAGSSGKQSPIKSAHPAMAVSHSALGSLDLHFTRDSLRGTFIDQNARVLDRFQIRKPVQ